MTATLTRGAYTIVRDTQTFLADPEHFGAPTRMLECGGCNIPIMVDARNRDPLIDLYARAEADIFFADERAVLGVRGWLLRSC